MKKIFLITLFAYFPSHSGRLMDMYNKLSELSTRYFTITEEEQEKIDKALDEEIQKALACDSEDALKQDAPQDTSDILDVLCNLDVQPAVKVEKAHDALNEHVAQDSLSAEKSCQISARMRNYILASSVVAYLGVSAYYLKDSIKNPALLKKKLKKGFMVTAGLTVFVVAAHYCATLLAN